MITPLLESKPSDENNAGCVFRRLAEQIAHPRGADTNEHLDEIGAGNTKERHTGFASHGSRQQCLASPRRADEQHALGQMAAQPLILFRMLEKLDNLDELFLSLIDAGDIRETHTGLLFDVDLRFALADLHEPAAGTADAVHEKTPKDKKQNQRHDPRQQRRQPLAARLALEGDARLFEFGRQPWIFNSDHQKGHRLLDTLAKIFKFFR